MEKQQHLKTFVRYVFLSMLGMLAVSLNTVADAVICGNGIGGNGIAGVNIGTPVISLAFACGMLFGTGGGTIFSIHLGKQGKEHEARRTFTESFVCVLFIGIIIFILLFTLRRQVPYILGASDTTYSYAYNYLMGVVWFIPVFAIDVFMNIYSRNDGAPNASMIATCLSVSFNIVVDAILVFVFKWGNFGAGFATGLSSVVSVISLIIMTSRRKKSNIRFAKPNVSFGKIKRMIVNGAGSFVMELSVGAITLIFNSVIVRDLGDTGLVVYGILTTLNVFFYSLISGIAQAMQPLISMNYGAGKPAIVNKFLKYALFTAVSFAILVFAAGFIFRKQIIGIFVSDEPFVIEMSLRAIKIFLTIYVFMGINIIVGTFFQSIEQGIKGFLIMIGRGMIAPGIAVALLRSSGEIGIWWAQPAGEAFMAIISIVFFLSYWNNQKNLN